MVPARGRTLTRLLDRSVGDFPFDVGLVEE